VAANIDNSTAAASPSFESFIDASLCLTVESIVASPRRDRHWGIHPRPAHAGTAAVSRDTVAVSAV
jgi:hypothetical protein